jgi:multiple sugar transport system permease protein
LLLTPLALVLLPFLIWPAVFGFFASFTNYAPAQFQVHWVGLGNYADIVGDSQFRAAFRNVVVFGLATVPAELAIGFAIAYLLREPFRGRELVRVMLYPSCIDGGPRQDDPCRHERFFHLRA